MYFRQYCAANKKIKRCISLNELANLIPRNQVKIHIFESPSQDDVFAPLMSGNMWCVHTWRVH